MNYLNTINVDWYELKKVGLCTYKIKISLSVENESKEFIGYISDPEYISDLEKINDSEKQNNCYFEAIEKQIEDEVNDWLNYLKNQKMKTYPKKVQNILNSFNENLDSYKECDRMIKELNKIGWEAVFYLHGELFNIKKIKNQ